MKIRISELEQLTVIEGLEDAEVLALDTRKSFASGSQVLWAKLNRITTHIQGWLTEELAVEY